MVLDRKAIAAISFSKRRMTPKKLKITAPKLAQYLSHSRAPLSGSLNCHQYIQSDCTGINLFIWGERKSKSPLRNSK